MKPIRAVSGLARLQGRPSSRALATDKVRFVGELLAMCVAPTRAQAEDIAGSVTLDLEELPAVHDMLAARTPASAALCMSIGATTSSSRRSSMSTSARR